MKTETLELVAAFHEALNASDAGRLLALVTADVEVGGPRGSAQGAPLVAEWMTRSGVRLTPGRVFARGPLVVVEQRAVWPGEDAGGQIIATLFEAREGRISRIVRFPDLAAALQDAGLDHGDAVPAPSAGQDTLPAGLR